MSSDNINDLNNEFAGSSENLGELSLEDEEAVERALRNIAAQMAGSSEDYNFENTTSETNLDDDSKLDEQVLKEDIVPEISSEDIPDISVEKSEEIIDENVSQEIDAAQQETDENEIADEISQNTDIDENIEETEAAIESKEETETTVEIEEITEVEDAVEEEIKESDFSENEITEIKPQDIQEETAVKEETEEEAETASAVKEESEIKDSEAEIEVIKTPEEIDDDNVVKKYIVYVSKDFVPYIDNLSIDERSAYINDAIQQKIDAQDEKKLILERKKIVAHIVIAVAVIIILTPFALLLAHKSIMATFENYKYSQDNFEKLYRHRFKQDNAYLRSLEYNKEYEKRIKNAK